MFRCRTFLALSAGLALVLASPLMAQPIDVPEVAAADFPQESWAIASYTGQLESDLGSSGEMSRHGMTVGFGHRFTLRAEDTGVWLSKRDDHPQLAIQALYDGSYYGFSGDTGMLKWNDIHTLSIVSMLSWKLGEKWTLMGGGTFRMALEGGADFHRALTGGALVGFEYRSSERLRLGLLLGAASQLEDGVGVLPLPTVDWEFTERWRFKLGLQTSLGNPGVGPELTFEPAEHWEIGIGAAYQKRRFRLKHRGSFPVGMANPRRNGIGQEVSFPVYARIRYVLPAVERGVWITSPRHVDHPTLLIDLYAGMTMAGELRLEDASGDKLADRSYDPAPTFGLRVQIPF